MELKVLILLRSVLRGTHTHNDHFRAAELRLTPLFLRGHGTDKTLILIVTAKVTQHTANVLIKESKQVLSLKKEEPAGRAELCVNTNDKSSVSSSFRPWRGLTLLWSECTRDTAGEAIVPSQRPDSSAASLCFQSLIQLKAARSSLLFLLPLILFQVLNPPLTHQHSSLLHLLHLRDL